VQTHGAPVDEGLAVPAISVQQSVTAVIILLSGSHIASAC